MNSLIQRRKRKQYSDQAWAREMAVIRQSLDRLTLFDGDLDQRDRIARVYEDFWFFCREYLPHYFISKTQAEFHVELFELAKVEEVPGASAEPRGFAKSTIISLAYVLWSIVREKRNFIVLCMETYEKAEMAVWRVLLELQYNRRIINDFGMLASKDSAHGDFTTQLTGERRTTTRVYAMGAGQSARGLINSQHRPDLFICDDLESRELARNPKRVAKLLELVLSDYLGCMCAEHWAFIVLGTIICVDSMLDQLMRNEFFNRLRHRAIETDDQGNERSTWEELHPLKKLQLLRQTMGPTKFAAEKQNEPLEEDGIFKQSWFRHWGSLPQDLPKKLVLQLDPSYSATGDNKAFGLGVRYQHTKHSPDFAKWRDAKGEIIPEGDYTILIELINRKCSIDEMWVLVYKIFNHWNFAELRIDGTYAQKIIFERELSRFEAQYGRIPNVKFIDLRESKHDRILALESPIERGLILFPPNTTQDVRETIKQFTLYGTTGVNDDGPDMIAALDEHLKPRKRKAKMFTGSR